MNKVIQKDTPHVFLASYISLGMLDFNASLKLPELVLEGELAGNTPPKLSQLLKSMDLSIDIIPEDMEISTATFRAGLENRSYDLSLEIGNLWKIEPFSIDKTYLKLHNDNGNLQNTFGCSISLTPSAKMYLDATYTTGEGWNFSGELTDLKMGEVIELLKQKFAIQSVPEPLQSLVLTRLHIDYCTLNQQFKFICDGIFRMDDAAVKMSVDIQIGNNAPVPDNRPSTGYSSGWNASFTGQVFISDKIFTVKFDTQNWQRNIFIASYQKTATSGENSVSLHNLVEGVSPALAKLVPSSLVVELKEIKFVFYGEGIQKLFLFGLQLNLDVDLREMPVAGDKLPDNLHMSIRDMQILFSSGTFGKEQTDAVNPLLLEGILPLPADGLAKGVLLSGELHVREHVILIDAGNKVTTLPPADRKEAFTGVAKTAGEETAGEDDIHWFDVKKQLGPVNFQRIGVAFADNTLSFALDASLAVGPVQLAMSGLRLGSSLSHFKPVFGLEGFSMSLKTGGFEMGGGFLHTTDNGLDAYYGTILINIGSFGLKALGGHIPAHPNPLQPADMLPACFFIYAHIEIPLGGPPCFSVQGFAGGFGINNRLILPSIEELPDYILLPGPKSKAPPQESTPEATVRNVVPKLQKYFIAEPGQYWMAAGISFTSFQMIEAFALVTVSFGVDLQIGLIGSCAMTLPKGTSHPIAYIEIVILASYSQSTGLLAIEGVLSPASYLFGDFCRITGGFAFYIWIDPPRTAAGPRRGDFVVSLGGYHPQFTIPDYYPKVPRIELSFNLGGLQVTGQAYFALTPAMLMAGGSLKAVWQLGPVRAWFSLGIDFMIAWAPFKYLASAYVYVGCSVNLSIFTLNVSIGTNLEIWGPPFGGKAKIDLEIISFDIKFGDQHNAPAPLLTWSEFSSQFLPADTQPAVEKNTKAGNPSVTNVLKASVTSGLNNSDTGNLDWIVDSDNFTIQAISQIPANRLRIGTGGNSFKELPGNTSGYNLPTIPVEQNEMPYLVFSNADGKPFNTRDLWNPQVNIKPMGYNDVQSVFDISLSIMDSTGMYSAYIVSLSLRPVVEDVAGALWDRYKEKNEINTPAFLESALTGVKISQMPRVPSVVNNVAMVQLLFQQSNRYFFNYNTEAFDPDYRVQSSCNTADDTYTIRIEGALESEFVNRNYTLSMLNDSWIRNRRNRILQNLYDLGFDVYAEASVACFGTQTALTDWPGIAKLGDQLS